MHEILNGVLCIETKKYFYSYGVYSYQKSEIEGLYPALDVIYLEHEIKGIYHCCKVFIKCMYFN